MCVARLASAWNFAPMIFSLSPAMGQARHLTLESSPVRPMKPTPAGWTFGIAVSLTICSWGEGHAQEENLQMALADQERRLSGMTSLIKQAKSFLSMIPGVDMESEEENMPEVEAAEVEMKAVKVIENEAASQEAIDEAAAQAAMEAEIYRQKLHLASTKLNINGAFPNTKEIMIGAKRLGIGEQIAIELQGTLFHLEILDINREELKLRDQKSNLEVSVEISVGSQLPPGMFRKPPSDQFKVAPVGVTPPPIAPSLPQED